MQSLSSPSPRPRLTLAAVIAAAIGVAACTPQTPHLRVDVRIDAQGRCQVEGEALDCRHAGKAMLAKHPGQAINAVILAGPNADPQGKEAVVASLAEAHITHLQFGDPATMEFESAASRPIVER